MRYFLILKEHWLALLIATVGTAVLAVGLSFIPDQLYESEVDLLIVQKQSDTMDSYTAQKAAEKLGNNLINVVYSLDFQNRVFNTGRVHPDQFSTSAKDNKKEWEELVKAQVVPETGIIKVYGYGTDTTKSADIALGVAEVLTSHASDYHGGGDSVTIKQIDGPITSSRPVKPNIPLNGLAAGMLGFMIVYTYFILRFESQRVEQEKQQLQLPGDFGPKSRPSDVRYEPVEPTKYRVLDNFPLPTDTEPTTMQDHLK